MNNFNDLLNTIRELMCRDDVDIVVKKYTENNTFNGEEFHQAERVDIIFEKKEEDGSDEDCEDESDVILKVSFEINPYYGFLTVKNELNERLYSNSKRFYVMKFKIFFENRISEKFDEENQSKTNTTFDDENDKILLCTGEKVITKEEFEKNKGC